MNESIYSGPGKSGICKCGCPVWRHHLSWVMRKEYIDETGERYLPGCCLRFGFNEQEGLDSKGRIHCFGYRDNGYRRHRNKGHYRFKV